MNNYLWKTKEFFDDFNKTLGTEKVLFINIATAYLSLSGAEHLKESIIHLNLEKEDVQIYCSSSFNDQEPATILKFLSTFSTVHIVDEPFLHSKVYEVHTANQVITYSGSANLTEGGLMRNFELMNKQITNESKLEEYWEFLWRNCVITNDEVISLYENYPVNNVPKETKQAIQKIQHKLNKIYERQCIESEYPDLTGYYFNESDYSVFNEKYWENNTTIIKGRRKATQEKFYELNEAIEPFAKQHDLYPHYKKEHLTSGIVPSIYNFNRVTGIWMRYGKHKSELNPFDYSSFGTKSSPIEQFHKHACLQLSIGSGGINIGMFHSTANDGIDCAYVDEHWHDVKEKIIKIYDKIKGFDFIWTFYSNKENKVIDRFKIDNGITDEFIKFYRKYDMSGFESFCMRKYETDDPRIKTYKSIVNEVCTTFEVILPLYKAMTYRIPLHKR